jgi:hypothetical protein
MSVGRSATSRLTRIEATSNVATGVWAAAAAAIATVVAATGSVRMLTYQSRAVERPEA